MTHLFLVKSWITHLVARAIVQERGLDPSRVVLLAVRGFDPRSSEFRTVRLPYGPGARSPFPSKVTWLPFGPGSARQRLKAFDEFVRDATGGVDFHYYSTNSRQRYNQALISHSRCTGFSYIECGAINYRTPEDVERLYPTRTPSLAVRKRYRDRIGAKTYFRPGYAHVYGVGPDAFPGFERRVELESVFTNGGEVDAEGIESVLVLDGMSAHQQVSLAAVEAGLRRALEILRAEGLRSLHYKFHPAQTFSGEDVHLESVIRETAGDIPLTRLDEAVILEELAMAAPHARFIVNVSSTCIYAARAGCEVLSFARLVADAEPAFGQVIADLPEVYPRSYQYFTDESTPDPGAPLPYSSSRPQAPSTAAGPTAG